MQNLLKNYKTTSAGLAIIIGSVVHLVFAVKGHTGDENTWTTALVAIAGGIGLMFAGDAAASAQAHADSTAAIASLQSQVRATAAAVVLGDPSMITKAVPPEALQTPPTGPKSAP